MKNILVVLSVVVSNIIFSQNWTAIGPPGGYFKEFTIHPSNPQEIIAGSDDSGGLWKSTDGGQTWTLLTGALPNFTGWKVVYDKVNTNIIYACDLYSRYGLIKSTDGGATWMVINSGLKTQYDKMVSGLVIAHGTHDTLLISTGNEKTGTPPRPGNGVFKSFDGGITWTPAGLQGVTTPTIATNGPGGAILVGTLGQGLKITTDFGLTWINHPQISSTESILKIETDDNIVMVSAAGAGIFLSTDYGNSFTNIGMVGEFNFDINIFRKTPNIELFSSTFSGLKKYSSQTGLWTPVNHPLLNNHVAIGIASINNDIYVSNFTNGLIIKSSDAGINWNTITESPKATEIGGLFIDPNNSNHIITSLLGTYNVAGLVGIEAISETTDGGINWTRKGPIGHGGVLKRHPTNFNTFYVGLFGKGLFKTTDNFATYTNIRQGNKVIVDIIINPVNTSEILISEIDITSNTYSVLKSIDGGVSFTSTLSELSSKLEYDPTNPSIVYAATFSGLFKSTDGGSSWSLSLFNGLPLSAVKPSANNLYAAIYNGDLYKITGNVTTKITGPWPANSQITNIVEHNGKIVIGINGVEKDTALNLNGAVFLSIDTGKTWSNISGNMNCTQVYGVNTLQVINNQVYVSTYGGGLYKSMNVFVGTPPISITNNDVSIFPNPTSDYVTIEINGANVESIYITDITGKQIKNLSYAIGNKQVKWDRTNEVGQFVSRGVYFVNYVANNISSTFKIILL